MTLRRIKKAYLYIEKRLHYVLPLSILKAPFKTPLYLQILLPLIGFKNLIIDRAFHKVAIILFAIPLWGVLLSIFYQDINQFVRSIQLLGIIAAFNFLIEKVKQETIIHWAIQITCVSAIVIVIEAILGTRFGDSQPFFGIVFERYRGVTGEPNYSSFVSLGCLVLLVYFKKYKWSFVNLIPLFLTGSRTGILCFFLFILSYIIYAKFNRINKFFLATYMWAYFLFPVVAFGTKYLSSYNFNMLEKLLSSRLTLYQAYIRIFLKYPLGVGYFNGRKELSVYQTSFFTETINEQHNILLQMLSELGIVGYITLVVFFYQFIKSINSEKLRESIVLIPTLTFTLLLNTGHEFIYYLALSSILSTSAMKKS